MTYEPIKAGPVFWPNDSGVMWTADAPHDAVSLGLGHVCPECRNPVRVVDSMDFNAGRYRCAPRSAGHVPDSQKARHAFPERWCEVERGDPPRLVMHLGETVSAMVEMRRHAP